MPRINYQDFDLLFAPTGRPAEYAARVFGESGDGSSVFSLGEIFPDDSAGADAGAPEEPAARHFKLSPTTPQSENYYVTSRRPPDFDDAKKLGGKLFDTIFKQSLRTAFDVRREQLRNRKTFLRLRLHLTDVPELAALPWEYLYNAESNHFYAQLPGTPVIRYLNLEQAVEDLRVDGALRMLVVISEPTDARALKVEEEWEKLQSVLKPLADRELLSIERLDRATIPDLQRTLQANLADSPFHIFHFIGHGVFDIRTGSGSLLFENADGTGRLVNGESLGLILKDQGFRLAVINACEGAVAGRTNSYAGVAQKLCREGGIPAVLAMQYEITDAAAIVFAENFYGALTQSFPVEAALAEARKAIRVMPNEVEWATPVLYMRSKDGRIGSDAADLERPAPTGPNGRRDEPPELTGYYDEMFEALRDGQFVPFIGLDANLLGRASDPASWRPEIGLPGNAELARYLATAFDYPLADLPDLARIAQFSTTSNRLGNLFDRITKIFTDSRNQPTLLHRTLAGLAAKIAAESQNEDSDFLRTTDPLRRRFLIVTTGFDNLFEKAFETAVRDFHVISYTARGLQRGKFSHLRYRGGRADPAADFINSPNDYTGLGDGGPVILKLPGTVEEANPRFAITEDDYFDYLTNRELTGLLPAVITGKLKNSNHLFLGYNPCSWNMRALLYRIWEDQRSSFRESWAILSDQHAIDRPFWQVCDVKIVPAGLQEFIDGLNRRVEAL